MHGKTNNLGTSPLPLTQTTHTATSVASASSHTKTTNTHHSVHDITSGCSRTIPISWNNSSLLQVCLCLRCIFFRIPESFFFCFWYSCMFSMFRKLTLQKSAFFYLFHFVIVDKTRTVSSVRSDNIE